MVDRNVCFHCSKKKTELTELLELKGRVNVDTDICRLCEQIKN